MVESQRQPVVFAEDITVMAETGVPLMSPLMPPPPPPPIPVMAAPVNNSTSSSITEQNEEITVEWGIVSESVNPDTGERTVIYGDVITSQTTDPMQPSQQSGADIPTGSGVPTVLTNIIGSRVEMEFNSAGEIIFIQILERPPPMLPPRPDSNPNNTATPAQNSNTNNNEITVRLNGETISFDVLPVIIDDRTLVPMRAIFEALEFDIEWNGETQTIIAERDLVIIDMQIGNSQMRVETIFDFSDFPPDSLLPTVFSSTETVILEVPPQIIDNFTFVPVRAIAEATGADVEWIAETQTIIITTN